MHPEVAYGVSSTTITPENLNLRLLRVPCWSFNLIVTDHESYIEAMDTLEACIVAGNYTQTYTRELLNSVQ